MKHTILVVAYDPVTTGICQHLVDWSEQGLIAPIGIIDYRNLPGPDQRVENLEEIIIQNGKEHRIDVLDWLAANYCELVRVVAIHSDPNSGHSTLIRQAAERCRSEISSRQGANQRTSQVACYLGAPTHGAYQSTDVSPAFQNVVIVPADQAMPGSSTTPVAPGDGNEANLRYVGVMTQTIATITGSWVFQSEGVFDDTTSGSAHAGVHVARSYVRTLDVPDPLPALANRALANEVLSRGVGWPLPSGAVTVVSASPPEYFAELAAQRLIEHHADTMNVAMVPPLSRPDPAPMTLLTALKMYGKYLATGLTSVPDRALTQMSRAASHAATNAVFGPNSQFEIVIGRRSRMLSADLETVERTVATALQMADPAADYMPPSYREVWQDFAMTVTALVDGSEFPTGIVGPHVGDSRAVIQQPALVIQSPSHSEYEVPGDLLPEGSSATPIVLTAQDPRSALRAQRLLKGAIDPTENVDRVPSDTSSGLGEDGTDGDSAENTNDPLREKRVKVAKDLDAWITDLRDCYSWKLGEKLADSLSSAESRAADAAEVLSAQPPREPDRKVDAKDKVLRSITTSVVVALVVLLWAQILGDGFVHGIGWAVAALILGVSSGFVSYLRALRRQFQEIYQYNARISEVNHAFDAFGKYSREVIRLSSLYWQYVRWTRILGSLVHSPYGESESLWSEAPSLAIESASLAVRSATATLDRKGLEAKEHDLRRTVFKVGWLQHSWMEAEGGLTDQFCARRALTEPPDPLDDSMRRSSGILDHLVEATAHGEHAHVARSYRIAEIKNEVSQYSLDNLVTDVRVDGVDPYPDAIAPKDTGNSDGLFGELLLFPEDLPLHYHHELWRGAGLDAPSTVDATTLQTTPYLAGRIRDGVAADPNHSTHRSPVAKLKVHRTRSIQHDGRTLYGTARVDLSGQCKPEDLVLFTEVEEDTATYWDGYTDDGGD